MIPYHFHVKKARIEGCSSHPSEDYIPLVVNSFGNLLALLWVRRAPYNLML